MFAEPTVADFLALIDWHFAKAIEHTRRAVGRIRSESAQRGTLQSGARIKLSIDAARTEFDAGIEAALGELRRVISNTRLDPQELWRHTVDRLRKFAGDVKSAAEVTDVGKLGAAGSKIVEEEFRAFDQHLKFAIRQFEVGLIIPPEPEVPPLANNSIIIGTMIGSAVQQASPAANQNVSFQLKVETVSAALRDFETELSKQQVDQDSIAALQADIATIRAQLSKQVPSLSIIQEAGKSIRNVAESVAANVLTSPIVQAAVALGITIGL